jgi:hypothetical protein
VSSPQDILTATAGRRNAESVQKQIDKAEAQLDSRITSDTKEATTLMEIVEELDASGNVVCRSRSSDIATHISNSCVASKVSNFDESVDQVQEVLRKLSNSEKASAPVHSKVGNAKDVVSSNSLPIPTENTANSSPKREHITSALKSHDNSSTKTQIGPSDTQPMSGQNFLPNYAAIDLDHELKEPNAIITPAKDELEARRELNHHLQQFKPMVATLTMDEDDFSVDDEYSDEEDAEYFENEFGMSNVREYMSDEYMEKMNALSRKYDEGRPNESFIAVDSKGKAPDMTGNVQTAAHSSQRTESSKTKSAKGVRFADKLDIATPIPENQGQNREVESRAEKKMPAPLSETVLERSSTKQQNTTAPIKPFQKLSKFKAARLAADVVSSREPWSDRQSD